MLHSREEPVSEVVAVASLVTVGSMDQVGINSKDLFTAG